MSYILVTLITSLSLTLFSPLLLRIYGCFQLFCKNKNFFRKVTYGFFEEAGENDEIVVPSGYDWSKVGFDWSFIVQKGKNSFQRPFNNRLKNICLCVVNSKWLLTNKYHMY